MFEGSSVALITPFKEDGSIDASKLCELVEYQIAHKTSAIVPCGTTGESATLNHKEHGQVIEIVVKQARKRISVLAGTGSNSTQEAIELTQHAKEVGADGALVIVPYYNKPTQQGMLAHFIAVAKEVALPIVIYNIPSRTGCNLLPVTLRKILDQRENIVGIKESSGSMDQISEIAMNLNGKKDFTILSGDDSLTLPIFSVGGKGVISVLANILPQEAAALCSAALNGNFQLAQQLHWKMLPLIKALFIETNPGPIKTAMELLGICSSRMRLPMAAMEPENRKRLYLELKNYGLNLKINL